MCSSFLLVYHGRKVRDSGQRHNQLRKNVLLAEINFSCIF